MLKTAANDLNKLPNEVNNCRVVLSATCLHCEFAYGVRHAVSNQECSHKRAC
jgi:hypothetical protein